MIWKAIDQYVYISILFCSIYMISYRKNKFISAIMLIVLFLLSNIFFIGLLFTIPLSIAVVITMGLIVFDLLEDYKKGKFKTSNFYMDLLIFFIGIILLTLVLIPLSQIGIKNLLHSASQVGHFLKIFNYYSLVLATYLCFNEYNDMIIKRKKSIEKNNQEVLAIKNKEELLIQNIKKELPNELKDEQLLLDNNINDKVSKYIPAEYVNQIKDISNQKIYTENEINYLTTHKSDTKKNLIFFLFLLFVAFSLTIINLLSYKTLNMEKMIKLKYDTNNYITDISYYAPWENYDPNHFYNEINKEAKELSYTEEQIKDIYPTYDKELQKRIKNSNIKVSLSKTKNLKNYDEVEVNVSYNQKKAKKNKIRFKHTHFKKEVNLLKKSITQEEYNKSNFDLNSIQKDLENKLKEKKITYNNLELKKETIKIETKDNYDISYLVLNYSLDGKLDRTFKDKEIKNITYKIEIFKQNKKVKTNFKNTELEY